MVEPREALTEKLSSKLVPEKCEDTVTVLLLAGTKSMKTRKDVHNCVVPRYYQAEVLTVQHPKTS